MTSESKNLMVINSINDFFLHDKNSKDHIQQFIDIVGEDIIDFDPVSGEEVRIDRIRPKSRISRRILDWFVIRYSCEFEVLYDLNDPQFNNGVRVGDEMNPFDVYTEYKSYLKSIKKTYFDPFCRRKRIIYDYGYGKKITTIGQLNFFRWCIVNKVLIYVLDHIDEIEADMNKKAQEKKEEKKALKLSKKNSLVIPSRSKSKKNINISRSCTKHYSTFTVDFD